MLFLRVSPVARARGTRPPRALPASESRGLRCAMRRKRPGRAAVTRKVYVATEMTSDLGGPMGSRLLAQQLLWKRLGRKLRCWRATVRDSAGPLIPSLFEVHKAVVHAVAPPCVTGPKDCERVWVQPTGGCLHSLVLQLVPGLR